MKCCRRSSTYLPLYWTRKKPCSWSVSGCIIKKYRLTVIDISTRRDVGFKLLYKCTVVRRRFAKRRKLISAGNVRYDFKLRFARRRQPYIRDQLRAKPGSKSKAKRLWLIVFVYLYSPMSAQLRLLCCFQWLFIAICEVLVVFSHLWSTKLRLWIYGRFVLLWLPHESNTNGTQAYLWTFAPGLINPLKSSEKLLTKNVTESYSELSFSGATMS